MIYVPAELGEATCGPDVLVHIRPFIRFKDHLERMDVQQLKIVFNYQNATSEDEHNFVNNKIEKCILYMKNIRQRHLLG